MISAAPGTGLQFSHRRLDSSLLTDLHVILKGINYTEIGTAVRAGQPADVGVRRIGGAQLAPCHVAHFYEFSAEFRRRMAVLTHDRIKDLAQNWLRRRARLLSRRSMTEVLRGVWTARHGLLNGRETARRQFVCCPS